MRSLRSRSVGGRTSISTPAARPDRRRYSTGHSSLNQPQPVESAGYTLIFMLLLSGRDGSGLGRPGGRRLAGRRGTFGLPGLQGAHTAFQIVQTDLLLGVLGAERLGDARQRLLHERRQCGERAHDALHVRLASVRCWSWMGSVPPDSRTALTWKRRVFPAGTSTA